MFYLSIPFCLLNHHLKYFKTLAGKLDSQELEGGNCLTKAHPFQHPVLLVKYTLLS